MKGIWVEVETSLLTTKLNIPPTRSKLVQRPQLYEQLQEGLNYKLILVSAPAGFGKTTLLSEWIHGSKPPIRTAWVSLDEGDNDPVRFWDYFVTALQIIQPDCGEKILPLLHSSPQPSVEPILTALINKLDAIMGDFVIVLDDYHLIETQLIHDGITYLIEHLSVGMHLVLATRADPPLPLAHFRGRGILMEIGADGLRFNLEDAASLFKELNTPEISMEDVAALNERTEGWAVGLKMAALSMSGQKDISGFITTFTGSHRYVMDYLMEEVLQKQIPELREFLYKTSVLKRLTAPLCDAVTGQEDSQTILFQLERGHLFIVPLDETRHWYRYEHLFSDLLRHQCQTTYRTENIATLHRKASQWYEDNNLPDDAIYHSLEAKDWETAMRLIYDRCEELRKRSEFGMLLGWLQLIPEELLRTHYRLYSQYASFLTTIDQYDAAEKALNYLESVAHDDANIQAEAAFSLANLARLRGDSSRCVDMAKRALSLVPPDNIVMRSRVNFIIGYVQYESGQFPEAKKWLSDAHDLGQQAREYTVVAHSLLFLGGIAFWNGKLNYAKETLKKAIEAGESVGVAAASRQMICRVFYELNDLEAVAEYARIAIESSKHSVLAETRLGSYMCQARMGLAKNDMDTVRTAIEKSAEISDDPSITEFNRAKYIAFRVIHAIRQDNLEEATNLNQKLSEYNDILHPECFYIPARLLVAQGKKEEAAKILQDSYQRLAQIDAYGLIIGIRICQALATDDEGESQEFLSDALIKAELEGYIRSFVDEGKLLLPLLEKALSKGITPEYTAKLIAIIEAEERKKRKIRREESIPSTSLSLLSERELEVLRLMAEGLSNEQIANRLIISISTAKNHVHNILQKLDARGRTRAVTQARELGLI